MREQQMARYLAENRVETEKEKALPVKSLLVILLIFGAGFTGYALGQMFTGPIMGPARINIAIIPSQVEITGLSMNWASYTLTISLQASLSTGPISGTCTATFQPSGTSLSSQYSGLSSSSPQTITLSFTSTIETSTGLQVVC